MDSHGFANQWSFGFMFPRFDFVSYSWDFENHQQFVYWRSYPRLPIGLLRGLRGHCTIPEILSRSIDFIIFPLRSLRNGNPAFQLKDIFSFFRSELWSRDDVFLVLSWPTAAECAQVHNARSGPVREQDSFSQVNNPPKGQAWKNSRKSWKSGHMVVDGSHQRPQEL